VGYEGETIKYPKMRGRRFVFGGQEQGDEENEGQESEPGFGKSQRVRCARGQPQQKSTDVQRDFLMANVAFSRFSSLAFSFRASAMVAKFPTWTVCSFLRLTVSMMMAVW